MQGARDSDKTNISGILPGRGRCAGRNGHPPGVTVYADGAQHHGDRSCSALKVSC